MTAGTEDMSLRLKRKIGRPDGSTGIERIGHRRCVGMMRLAAAAMSALDPLPTGERGVIVSTASVAASRAHASIEAA